MREAFHPFTYEDLKQNTAYIVVAGRNGDFWPGLVFWINPRDGSLCIAGENGGWLEKGDISDDLFLASPFPRQTIIISLHPFLVAAAQH